jgi:hypothetical protein
MSDRILKSISWSDATMAKVSKGPIADEPLTSHPLGVLLTPNFADPWSGPVSDLAKECMAVIRAAKDVLHAFMSQGEHQYSMEEDLQVSTLDEPASHGILLAVIHRQRTVWKCAKEIWPTIQFQYQLFSELVHKLSHMIIITHSSGLSAPEAIAKTLRNHRRRLERVCYCV